VLGSISGFVRDPSAAAVPGATIAVTNSETGVVHTVMADDRGHYRALSLPVGRYDVRSSMTGFRSTIRFGIELAVAQDAVIDIDMQLGVLKEDVQISGEAPW